MIGTINPTVAWQTHPCIKGGEYLEFTAIAGEFYTFSFCMAGGSATFDTQITILDATGNDAGGFADDDCLLQSHLPYWFCPANGTYRVLVSEYYCTTGSTCGIMAYKRELQPGGPGSTCGNPYSIPSLPFAANGFSTCGFGYDYSSANACGSQYMNDEDFVFRFNGTAGQCISIFTNNTFTYTGLFLVRGCPNVGGSTCIAYNEGSSGTPYLSNVTLPTTATYYIIVDGYAAAPPDCTPFDLEVMNCVGVGQGNNCSNAFPIPSIPYSQNGFTTCGKGNAYDSGDACGSAYMDGEDFVFRYTSPGNECVSINVLNSFSYTGVHVFDACPNLASANCIAQRGDPSGDPEIRYVELANPGTYYIVVSTWPSPNCTPFNLSITPCAPGCTRNPNAADNCSAPTPISIGLNDTVCGVANYSFLPDASPNLANQFCGSIENNSWFRFIADSTQMTIRVDVPDCMSGFGLQAQVFSTTNCNTFTAVSPCWNPQYQTSGFIQSTGLVVGQPYYLMIDGYAGDDCEYQLTRIGQVLPVEWGIFTAVPQGQEVIIDWSTAVEENVAGFHIQRGRREGTGVDNMRWENAGYVRSKGDTPEGHAYHFVDKPMYTGETWYYRIQEIDLNGLTDFTDIIAVEIAGPEQHALNSVHPVPASSNLTFTYYCAEPSAIRLGLFDLSGRQLFQDNTTQDQQGMYEWQVSIDALSDGLYFYLLTIGSQTFKGKVEIIH